MNREKPTATAVEYVRLLGEASKALRAAAEFCERDSMHRPAYGDLIMLETLQSQLAGRDYWWVDNPADAMARIVDAGQFLPVDTWDDWSDSDMQSACDAVGALNTEDDEVCGSCGARFGNGFGEVVECENAGCTGACSKCQDLECPKAVRP